MGVDGLQACADHRALDALIHDRMVETVVDSLDDLAPLFERSAPQSYREIDLLGAGVEALFLANRTLGLALTDRRDQLSRGGIRGSRGATPGISS